MAMRNIRWTVAVLGITLSLLMAGCQTPTFRDDQTLARADLVFGPYVSAVSPDGASVHWISPPGVDGSCRLLGDSRDPAVKIETSVIAGRQEMRHTAVITGLKADQRHWYAVEAGRERAEGSFRTPPAVGAREPFSFIITGDTQSFPLRIRFGAEAIAKEAPAFIVHTGDLCNNTPDWALLRAEFFEPWRDLLRKAAIWPARGNHENGPEPFASLFALSPTQPWYSFDYGNLHVVILDQWALKSNEAMEPERMTAMAEWLDRDLAAAREKADWIIIAGHQQMFNVAGHGSTWGHEQILPLLYKRGVDLVVSGHSHLYERFVPIGPPGAKPIQFLVAGGGGGHNYPSVPSPILVKSHPAPHYCLYRIEGERLDLTVKGPDGAILDYVVMTKADGQVSPNVRAAAITPEDALRLLKIYKGIGVNVTEAPVAGRALACSLSPRRFPPGSKVTISTDPGSPWAVEEAAFQAPEGEAPADSALSEEETEAPEPWLLKATPPANVLLGGQSFSPHLSVAIRLEYKGRTWVCPSVPIDLHETSIRRLAPAPQVVDVPSAAKAIAVDGDLDEWEGTPFLHLPSTGSPSRSLRLAWTEGALFGAVVVEQGEIHSDDEVPWIADSLEVNLEADALRRTRLLPRGPTVKFFLWPQPGSDGGKASFKRSTGRLPGGSVQAAWRKTPTGYTMEFRISARALTVVPEGAGAPNANESPPELPLAAGRMIGLDLVLRHDGLVVEQFANPSGVRSTWGSPIYWGQIRLSAE